MRANVAFPAIAALALFITASLGHSEGKEPAWLLLEEGKALEGRKEYGEALFKYRQALVALGTFPEAEMAIGDIYRLEGESDLAVKQYEKAYNLRNAFYISDSKYEVLYKLTSILENQQLYRQMETRLLEITAADQSFNPPKGSRLKDQVIGNFMKGDINSVLKIYRFNSYFAASAHSKLGWFYYKTGRFELSIEHYLYAIITKVTRVVQSVSEDDPEYQFAGLDGLVRKARAAPGTHAYIVDTDLPGDLYYLAGAVFQNGKPQHATTLWQMLLGWNGLSGRYADLSKRQLKSPWIEPYLQLPSRARRD